MAFPVRPPPSAGINDAHEIYLNKLVDAKITAALGGDGGDGVLAGVVPIGGIMLWPDDPSLAGSNWALTGLRNISRSAYPAFAAIADRRGWAGDGPGTVGTGPAWDGRAFVAPGDRNGLTSRALGDTFGTETVTLTQAMLPACSFVVTDPGHFHPVDDPDHSHPLVMDPHSHPVTDPGHDHDGPDVTSTGGVVGGAGLLGGTAPISTETTGITIDNATSTGTITAAATGITIDSEVTGITVDSGGSDTPFAIWQPSIAGAWPMVRIA